MDKPETQAPEKDAEVLFPERTLTVDGEAVTVREFSFLEEMRLAAMAEPLLERLRELSFDDEQSLTSRDLERAFVEHEAVFVELLAVAVDKPADWVRGLTRKNGQALMTTFWSVNHAFFTERMITLQLDRLTGSATRTSKSH
ncbi:MAG: DUF6631 family protein [Hyphomicrobiales bacterium]